MSLFQKSVVLKHLQSQNKTVIQEKWQQFQNHFQNPTIQENIRNSKEEQYQGEFLIDLFVAILGYTKNPQPDFNLTTEYKNVKDSKKADGAILIDDKVKAVIELKGTNTTDLGKIETQAFGYKNNQPDCVYVITSNFEKLRFYIDNAIEHLEFNLFKLTQEEFNLLYLCLAHENISKDVARKIKNESVSQEDVITKKLYKDYSVFKRELYQNMVALNSGYEPLELFKKSQKLLDRFLFVFFAEDRNLLPTNLIFRINKEWKQLREMRIEVSLYDRYKIYFNDLNSGAKVSLPAFSETVAMMKEEHQIFAYNGGLFKPDDMLDNISIDDAVLFTHTERLSHYDFASEVDVNILGHIFENSLNELDETKAQLEGQEIDKTKTKRKKDGVFYTPKYITKYIVENTIGKLCIEKKAELQLVEEDYTTDKKRQKKTMQGLVAKLEEYRKWLLQLTICDPACGSGAFLNQALDFLIEEHRYVDELQAKIFGDALVLSDIENSILENNLFGVDLNDESVEIAKLSLWLRTAQPNRKLNDLNSNIKCGNSLIENTEVAGDKAFNWQEAFPKVFAKGGFDVIIGNPPYVQSHALDERTKEFIYKNYSTAEYQINTYAVFTEKIIKIIQPKGIYSIIIPNYWLSTKYDSKLRELVFLLNNCVEIVNVFRVFEDATVDTLILTGKKSNANEFPKKTLVLSINKSIDNIEKRLTALYGRIWAFDEVMVFKDINSDINLSFDEKLKLKGEKLVGDFLIGYQGMKPYEMGKGSPVQTRQMMNERIYNSDFKLDETYHPLIGAGNVQRYNLRIENSFIKYGKNLAAPRKFEIFSNPRILVNRILSKKTIDAIYLEEVIINNTDVFNFIPKDVHHLKYLKPILAILTTNVCSTYFKTTNINLNRQAFPKLNVNNILDFPLPDAINEFHLNYLSDRVDKVLAFNKEIQEVSQKFRRSLQRKFEFQDLPKKLQEWYLLTYAEFIKELAKKKIKLTLSEEAEWEDYFNQESKKALELKSQIDTTDKKIDQMVYELYGLSDEEIMIVEGN